MFHNNFEENDTSILDEMESFKQKKKSMKSVLSKKKLNKYEMDEFFMGG